MDQTPSPLHLPDIDVPILIGKGMWALPKKTQSDGHIYTWQNAPELAPDKKSSGRMYYTLSKIEECLKSCSEITATDITTHRMHLKSLKDKVFNHIDTHWGFGTKTWRKARIEARLEKLFDEIDVKDNQLLLRAHTSPGPVPQQHQPTHPLKSKPLTDQTAPSAALPPKVPLSSSNSPDDQKVSEFVDEVNKFQQVSRHQSDIAEKINWFIQVKNNLESHLTNDQKKRLNEGWTNLFQIIATNYNSFLKQFLAPIPQNEKCDLALLYAKSSSYNFFINFEHFSLETVWKHKLAINCLDQKINISDNIEKFDILNLSEEQRYDLVRKESILDCNRVSANIQKYHLNEPHHLLIAQMQAKTNPYLLLYYIDNYEIKDQKKLFDIYNSCIGSIEQYNTAFKIERFPLEERKHLLIKLAETTNNFLFDREMWESFKFDKKTSAELLPILTSRVIERNPLLLYEQFSQLVLPEAEKDKLKKQIPFFDLERRINALGTEAPSETKENLRTLLHELHEINKKSGLPESIWQEQIWSTPTSLLSSKVTKIIESCTSLGELLELSQMFNQKFFCGTTVFQKAVCRQAIKLEKKIESYLKIALAGEGTTVLLSQQAMYKLTEQKIKTRLTNVTIPQVTYIRHIAQEIQKFYSSKKPYGFFLINFYGESFGGHYSPLIVERRGDVLHILNSDSVYKGAAPFTEQIIGELKKLSPETKIKVYFVPDQRQFDCASCPIFSMGDLTEAAKIIQSGKSFFDHLPKEIVDSHSSQVSVPFKQLPLGMIRMTQSLTAITHLAQRSFSIRRRGQERKIQLNQYLDEKSYYMFEKNHGHKKRNLAASIKLCKQIEKVLGWMIEEPPSSPSTLHH